MVVRYPHTATVTAVVTTVTDGEYASESETTTEIKGRIDVDGVTYTIIYWWEYQTYSEIWLD